MNCRTAKKKMAARLDEVWSGEQEAALQQHLQSCAACSRTARENDVVFQWLQQSTPAEPSENFEWRLKLRLAELDRSGQRVPLFDAMPARRRWTLRFAVAAAMAAALVLSVGLMRFEFETADGSASSQPTVNSGPRLVDPQPALDGGRSVAQPRTDLPHMQPWPRPVPVRYGVPLGPEYPLRPAPSILGPEHTEADTTQPQPRRGGVVHP